MKEVYLLLHLREYSDGTGADSKLLGAYSSLEEIEKVMPHYLEQEGFRDYPDGFRIDKYELDEYSDWNEGFVIGKNIPLWAEGKELQEGEAPENFARRLCKERYGDKYITVNQGEFDALMQYGKKRKVYVLWHEYRDASGEEITKCLGIYSSLELVEQAKDEYRTLPGFSDKQEGFFIDEFLVNRNQ